MRCEIQGFEKIRVITLRSIIGYSLRGLWGELSHSLRDLGLVMTGDSGADY